MELIEMVIKNRKFSSLSAQIINRTIDSMNLDFVLKKRMDPNKRQINF